MKTPILTVLIAATVCVLAEAAMTWPSPAAPREMDLPAAPRTRGPSRTTLSPWLDEEVWILAADSALGPGGGGGSDDGGGGSDTGGGGGSDDGGGSTGDDGGGDPAGGSDDGSSDSSESRAERAERLAREEVAGATAEVMDEIAAARQACHEYASTCAAYDLAAAYRENEGYTAEATRIGAMVAGTTDAILSSGAEMYAGIDEDLSERQSRLRYRQDEQSAIGVGDPVRISDGAFLFEIPLPVIQYWGVQVDLTLRYDSARSEASPLGPGWWWYPAQRLIPGVRPLADLQPLIDAGAALADASHASLIGLGGTAFAGIPGECAPTEIDPLVGEWARILERLNQAGATFQLAEERAAPYPDLAEEVANTQAEIDELSAQLRSEMRRFGEAQDFCVRSMTSEATIARERAAIETEQRRFAAKRSEWETRVGQQIAALPSGAERDALNLGAAATVLFDSVGSVHTFHGEGAAYRTARSLPGYRATPPSADVPYVESPTGVRSVFGGDGRLEQVLMAGDRSLNLVRDHSGRLTEVHTETGEVLVSVVYSGSFENGTMRITMPELDPTTIRFGDSRIVRVDGPRGGVELEWRAGLLRRITRDDGTWTEVAWSGATAPRATEVVQSHGARDRYAFGPGDRRVYTDPDGLETVYQVTAGRVEAVDYPSGLVRTWRFDADGHLVEIRDNRGGGEERCYDAAGRILSVDRSDGTWTRARYDSHGRLVRIDDDRGLIVEQLFRSDSSVAAWTGADGVRYTTSDGSSGEAVTVTRAGSPYLEIVRDGYGNPTEIVRCDGRREELRTTLYGTVIHRSIDGVTVLERTLDRAGRLTMITEGDHETRFIYDEAGNLRETIRDGSPLMTTDYDSAGRAVRIVHADGSEERTTWSAGGRVLIAVRRDGRTFDVRRDARGRIVTISERDGDREWRFGHGEDGRIVRTDSTVTGLTTFLYSATGTHIGFGYADGSSLRREYLGDGRLELRAPAGSHASVTIDAAGRLLRVVDESSTTNGSMLTYRWGTRSVTLTRDGQPVREVQFDTLGRVIRRAWPDGTAEELAYHDHGRRIVLTDRRGGRHEALLDRWRRPVRMTAPDGSWFSLRYEGRRIVEEHRDGTTITYLTDASGEIREKRVNGTRVELREPVGSGTVRSELFDGDGTLLASRELDANGRVVGIWSSSGSLLYAAEARTSGVVAFMENGHPATQEAIVPAFSYHYRLGSDEVWEVERTILGRITGITAPDGSRRTIEWTPAGSPARIGEPGATGGTVETRFGYEDGLLVERIAPGEEPLRVERDDTLRRITLTAGGARRVVTTGPYGLISSETLSPGNDAQIVATRVARDEAGRVRQTDTSVDGATTSRAGPATYRPDGTGVDLANDVASMSLTLEGGRIVARIDDRERIEITREGVEVDARIRSSWSSPPDGATETMVMEVRRPSGFVETLAATVLSRNDSGQVTAEQDLDGSFRYYSYDDAGRVAGSSGTGIGSHLTVEREVRRELERAWRAAALSVAAPTVSPEVAVGSFPAARPANNARDTVSEWAGLGIGYDATTAHPNSLRVEGGPHWTVLRDLDGNPLLVREEVSGRVWSAATFEWESPLGTLVVRSWESAPGPSSGGSPRYRAGDTRLSVTEPGSGSSDGYRDAPHETDRRQSCIEVRRDHILIAIIEPTAIHVPFIDQRGTVRGMARLDRETGSVRYTAGPTVAPAIDPAFARPGSARAELFPPAVPYDRIVYGMVHLPATAALLSETRLYIPATGRFTTRDPALHHLDWYLYAAGDPVNLIDPRGTIFTGARRDLSDTQQGGWWESRPLGRSSRHTISRSGCVLTAVSNTINTVTGRRVTDPGSLNADFMEGFYTADALLSPEAAGEALAAVTGRHVELVSFEPRSVDMAQIAAALAADTAQQYVATARIQTYADSADGERTFYEHTVNVAGFDDSGMPILVDTSNRNRVTLDAHESVLRYDVYAYSRCRSY